MARSLSLRGVTLHACGLLGVAVLALGITLVHLRRGLFDSEAFAHRLSASLADQRVSAFVAERITDAVLRRSPDLTAYRPLVRASAQGTVSSSAFRSAMRVTARTAHHAAFSEGGRELLLSVEDADVLLRGALAHANPEIAAKVPTGFKTIVTSLGGTRSTRLLLELGQKSRRLAAIAWTLVFLGILLLVGSVLLATSRRRALLHAAGDLAGAGLLVALLLPVGRLLVSGLAPDPLGASAAAGLFDAFAGGLRSWALALAGIGLVFAAAARSLLEDITVPEALRRAAHFLEDPPGGLAGRLARALLLLAAGTLAWLRPEAAVSAVTLLCGAGLAFLGLLELFRIVQRGLVGREAEGEVAAGGPSRGAMRALTVLSLAGLLAVLAAWLGRVSEPAPAPPIATETCNGHLELCGRRLDEVVLAGAHNAMSSVDVPRWMFPQQEKGVAGMLADGVRALLVDVHYGRPVLGEDRVKTDLQAEQKSRERIEKAVGEEGVAAAKRIRDRLTGKDEGPRGLYLCHGFCELGSLPLVPWLRTVHDFLASNPGEVVVLVLEDYVEPADLAAAFAESGLERFVYRGPTQPPWPTLRELLDSRQRAIVFIESGRSGVEWLHAAFATIQETPYSFHKPDEFSCAVNRGGTTSALFQINHWIDTTPAPKPSNAAIVNAHDFLLARARQCQEERKRRANIVAVDFYRTGDLFRVVSTLNGLLPPPAP
jgi:hypothetical protein